MAAVYLHNALYSSNSPENPRDNLAHSRNLSSLSNTTLFTSTTHHSHPTEPLLQQVSPVTEEDTDQIASPRNDETVTSRLRWDNSNVPPEHPTPIEKGGCVGGMGGRRGRCRLIQFILEFAMVSWAAYNTIRYFLAFAVYRDPVGQTFCVALGTSAGTSFALTLCTLILSLLRGKLRFSIDDQTFTFIHSFIRFFASICLVGPAIANFVLVFLWRNSPNSALTIQTRCHWDIDVVWSAARDSCSAEAAPAWTWWVVGILIRLVMTIVIVTTISAISILYPDQRPRRRHRHYRPSSHPSIRQHHSASSIPPVPSLTVHHPSETSLNATLVETPMAHHSAVHLAQSRSSEYSAEGSLAEHASFGRSTLAESAEQDRELTGFVDRFRSLISQITLETEEALEIAQSEGASSPNSRDDAPSPTSLPPAYVPDFESPEDEFFYDDQETYDQQRNHERNMFNLPPVPAALGYNEFGLPYPPDENVRILNGLIRRMPTIESMGSGEIGSLGASSSRPNGSMHTSSRPPTRNTLLSWTTTDYEIAASNPPSRSNSLSARAELLAGVLPTTEHGELMNRESGARRPTPPSTPSSMEHPVFLGSTATHESQSTNGSRSTHASYYTASMASSANAGPSSAT
ncbi:hypothetical protein CPB83DRAFT_853238 [Crepidotus variabilis]|uniref:Transmembrane protein n=1 Tax=Crepidotus variabilis TaxID=179855 RepID=A0A9P6EHK9_9AGAR|nr:hypothetical protein CPB83DRAFT_853238 [Crepidotus variabilis]